MFLLSIVVNFICLVDLSSDFLCMVHKLSLLLSCHIWKWGQVFFLFYQFLNLKNNARSTFFLLDFSLQPCIHNCQIFAVYILDLSKYIAKKSRIYPFHKIPPRNTITVYVSQGIMRLLFNSSVSFFQDFSPNQMFSHFSTKLRSKPQNLRSSLKSHSVWINRYIELKYNC